MDSQAFGIGLPTSFALALVGCVVIRDFAVRRRMVDLPNERSLHSAPVPRLGGVAVVFSVVGVLLVARFFLPVFASREIAVWLASALVIASLGLADDLWPLPALARLVAQVVVAAVGVGALGLGARSLELVPGATICSAHWLTLAAAVVFVVGATNIYNFMDGMDGLASVQAIGASVALGLAAAAVGQRDVAFVALVIGAAAAGFFVCNAPPATLFLGDAGSTFFGLSFSLLAIVAASRPSPVPASVVPFALSPFLLDGTFTILRRLSKGERIWQAHRSHLYQRAVATKLGHRDVLVVYSVWCAFAAAGAAALASADGMATAIILVGGLAPLVLVWRWVVRREMLASAPSQ